MGGAGAISSGTSSLTRRRLGLIALSAPMAFALPVWADGVSEGDGSAAAEQPEGIDAPAPGTAEADAPRDPHVGSVTHLPLPRYVSLKTGQGNARRGPGLTHRIDWVFTRAGMPLKITAEYEHWRRVEDQDGAGGWVHYSLLSGVRSVLVTTDMTEFRASPDAAAEVVYQAELNVVGKLLACTADWARVVVSGETGWAKKTALWGVDPGEVFG
jgi:SH3-like domain-containing protein